MSQLKTIPFFACIFPVTLWISLTMVSATAQGQFKSGSPKQIIIENFDSGTVDLTSYPGEDADPDDWELNSAITYDNSPWSLKLFGNTWKVESIAPFPVDTGDVWQISAYIESQADIQGLAIMDSVNVLFYSFAGSEQVNIEEWVPVYQGCFAEEQWNDYHLPIADDWMAFFDYLPEINAVVFINDRDDSYEGTVYFDHLIDITNDLPVIPEVSISYTLGKVYTGGDGNKSVDVQFHGEVLDPDSGEHDFLWDFGDDSTSTEQDPQHTFLITDNHPYRVLLRVTDSTNRRGQASCSIDVDPGTSSFPVIMNFVGDIMLARRYENPGGIIPTLGVEAIFEPTLPILGDAADITIANLECPLTTYGVHHPTKSIYFKGSPENVSGLTFAGIDMVSLANNHTLDYMLNGMQETQSVLEENGIIYMGAGANSYEAYLPAFYSKSGVNFAFIAASDRTGQYSNDQPYLNAGYNKPGFANLDPYYIKKQIDEVKDISDLVILEWHTGTEYSTYPDNACDSCTLFGEDNESDENYFPLAYAPDPKDRATTHFAIDNGADLVICHHPHIIQGVELYNGKLIAHSMGNFVFDQEYPETYPSFILSTKVDETGFYEFILTPVYIDDYIPRRAKGALGLHILDDLAKRSKDLDTWLEIDRDSVVARVIMDTAEMISSFLEYTAIIPMEESGGSWVSLPFPLERSGSISSVDTIVPSGNYEFRLGRDLIWFGTMEDEGCTLWNLNSSNEFYCDTAALSGERSIVHIRTENSSSNIITNFEERIICPDDTSAYSLCGFVKTQNAADVTIEIRYHSDRTGIIPLGTENIGSQVNGNTPWTFYHKELSIPAGTKFLDIRLNSGIPESGTAYSWFDNVSLIRWDDWKDYPETQTLSTPNDFYFIQAKSSVYPGDIVLTYSETGYANPVPPVYAGLKVYLEGPYNGFDMDTDLTGNPADTGFPLSQPYNSFPWTYNGTESVDTIPNPDVVDWILVEFRDAPDAVSASQSTIINRQAAFVLRDGRIVATDGQSYLQFTEKITNQLFAVVRHRNHIGIMSAVGLTDTEGIYHYDFTNSVSQVYGGEAGYKLIAPGIYGMAGGDSDANGSVEIDDKIFWGTGCGNPGYLQQDLNLDGQVKNQDKNDIWILNNENKSSQIPE